MEPPSSKPQQPSSNPSSQASAASESGGAKYEPPSWSAAPTLNYWFSAVKEGVEIDSIDLSSRPVYIIGRQNDVCQIVMEHQSISRQHAVIQHRNDGTVWVYDLGSTHGTFWNKKQIQPHTHVQVRPGDTLKFGQSTRLYTLMGGPPGLDDDYYVATDQTCATPTQQQPAAVENTKKTSTQDANKPLAAKDEDANQLTARFNSDESMMKEVVSRVRGFDEDFRVDHDDEAGETAKTAAADKTAKQKKRKKQQQQPSAKRSKRKGAPDDEDAPVIVSDEENDPEGKPKEEGDEEPEPEFDEDFNEYGGRVRVRTEEELGEGTLNLFDEEDDFYDRTKQKKTSDTSQIPTEFDFD